MTAKTLLAEPPPALVRELLGLWGRRSSDPRLTIDPHDEMLEFLCRVHEEDREQALCAYYRSGCEIAAVLGQILAWRFGDLAAPAPSPGGRPGLAFAAGDGPAGPGARHPRRLESLLDFASGYGRVTRFLLDWIPAERLWVSDVLEGAVAFQHATFGVHGVVSARRPEQLQLDRRFTAITVTSLFTHLPEQRFGSWLAALWSRLAPGGVLLFSTHDVVLHPQEERRRLPIAFEANSESRSLSLDEYGTTWVGEEFVRAAIRDSCGRAGVLRLCRALCNFQDLWVVVPEPDADFSRLVLEGEPELAVEECTLAEGELSLAGWAISRHGVPERVEVTVDGELRAAAPVGAPLPHVAAILGDEHLRCGWSCRLPLSLGEARRTAVLGLSVVDRRGTAHVAFVGHLDGLLAVVRRAQVIGLRADLHRTRCELADYRGWAEHQLAGARARIAAMEASRFWKLRNSWFAVKRALRLTDER